MNYAKLKEELQTPAYSLKPAYAVSGSDAYLVSAAVKLFKGTLDDGFAAINFVCLEDDVPAALEALDTFPVFDSHKVVALRLTAAPSEADAESIRKYLISPSPEAVLLLVGEDAALKPVRTKQCESVKCDTLSSDEIDDEIAEIISADPICGITSDAQRELKQRTQCSMARIVSELAKLKAYCNGTISYKDVCELVTPDLDYQFYVLTDAVSKKESDKALKVLSFFEENGVKGSVILSSLYNRYRQLLHVSLNASKSNEELGAALGVKSTALYFIRGTAEQYSQKRLKASVDYLHNLQYSIVSGKRSENSAPKEAVLTLLNI